MKHYLTEGGKKQENDIIKKEKHRRLLVFLLIFKALTNKVINKVTGALVTISIGRAVIVLWNYVWKFQYRALTPLYTEEYHPAQVLISITVSSGFYWIGQSEAALLHVGTLFISFYHLQLWGHAILQPETVHLPRKRIYAYLHSKI